MHTQTDKQFVGLPLRTHKSDNALPSENLSAPFPRFSRTEFIKWINSFYASPDLHSL